MKAVVAAFNQEKALVGAFSVITNLLMQFGCNFLKHYRQARLLLLPGLPVLALGLPQPRLAPESVRAKEVRVPAQAL